MPASQTWLPMRDAWETALYGPGGFYLSSWPEDHFRTSVHTSPLFADAVLSLLTRLELRCVVDIGAGRGELLHQLHARDQGLDLVAVEVRPRPDGLPAGIDWRDELPNSVDGLVIANEVLDNVPCDVVEVDSDLVPRIVEVDPATASERLGSPAPADVREWLDRWWPIKRPGDRAEVGLSRERWWRDVSGRLRTGACLAIDYGHTSASRPLLGSLASYRRGRVVPVGFTGDRDITADVAMDAVQHVVGGTLRRQSDWLGELGIHAQRPPLELASSDPARYLRELSQTGQAAELTAAGGLGDFWWLLTTTDDGPSDRGAHRDESSDMGA